MYTLGPGLHTLYEAEHRYSIGKIRQTTQLDGVFHFIILDVPKKLIE